MSIVKEIGPAGDWITNRAAVGKASSWTTRKTWAVLYGTDGSKIGLESNAVDTQFNTPEPGIDSISVKFKGSLGSLREVSVNYTCWTNDQLKSMSKSYMQLGRSVALLFGWSVTDEGDRTNVSSDGIAKGSTFTAFHTDIKKVVKKNRGCVTGYKGQVDNFTFALNDNGSYTCTCHFITPGEAALDVNMDLSTDGDGVKSDQPDGKAKKPTNLVKKLLTTKSAIIRVNKPSKNRYFNVVLERERNKQEQDAESWYETAKRLGGINSLQDTDTPYITWGYLEKFIIPSIFPTDKNDASIYTIDSTDIEVINHPTVHALDPSVAHIPGKSVMDDTTEAITGLPPASDWTGKLTEIYINLNFLIDKAQQSKKLQDFLNSVLDGITSACNNQFDFSVQVSDEDPSKLRVVDSSYVQSDRILPHVIEMYGDKSVCKNVSLDTQVPQGMKAEIIYGSNADAGGTSNYESAEFSFQPGQDELTPSNNDLKQPLTKTEQAEADKALKDAEQQLQDKNVKAEELYATAVADLFGGIDKTTLDSVKGAFNSLPKTTQAVKDEKDKKGENVLIPLNLSFDLDGIDGIPYGAMIQGNFIPGVYKEFADFMVKGISHDVSADEWKTSIETIMRRKS